MTIDNESNPPTIGSTTPVADSRYNAPLRLAPAVVMVAVFWIAFALLELIDLDGFSRFMGRMAAALALTLAFAIWWLIKGGGRVWQRLSVFGWAVVFGIVAMRLRDPSIVPQLAALVPILTIPVLITAWTGWLIVRRQAPFTVRRSGMIAIALAVWAATLTLRMEGLRGHGQADFHLRWTPTGEDRFLAKRTTAAPRANSDVAAAQPLVAGPHDWTNFRGPNRDGAVKGVKIATDWDQAPPKLVWRRPVGPGWSSITIVGNRLFTQEQRGEREAVVCCDTFTGDEIWSHEDKARFSEAMGGDGPRATPTFHEGLVYSLGATGALNCLNAATGELKWTRNIADDTGAETPYWGFTSSPLVAAGVVIVFAGGDREDSLLGYDAESGKPAWRAASGIHSYSSPQLATFDGETQVIYLSDLEVTAIDPATGHNSWRFESDQKPGEAFPSIQPHIAGPNEVIVSFAESGGSILLEVTRDGEGWKAEPRWKSRDLKPYFNDFVQHEDSLYGFDGKLFGCVDVETGKRRWKKGRYGAGQALLLADQGVLVVITESGEAVLVAADPAQHRELGRFQAITGKTWNHPTIVDGRLYVRNAEEMACYELKLK